MEDIREDLKKRSHPHFHGKVPELQAKIKLKGEKALWIEHKNEIPKNLIEFYYWTCEISSHFPKQWDDYYIILLSETIIITKSDSKHKNVCKLLYGLINENMVIGRNRATSSISLSLIQSILINNIGNDVEEQEESESPRAI